MCGSTGTVRPQSTVLFPPSHYYKCLTDEFKKPLKLKGDSYLKPFLGSPQTANYSTTFVGVREDHRKEKRGRTKKSTEAVAGLNGLT